MLHGGKVKDIARLDRPIEIYLRESQETAYGHKDVNVLISDEWADEIAKTRTMRENIMGGKESSIQEVHFRIRAETLVTTRHYVKYGGYFYDIITILPEGRDYQVLVTQLRPDQQWPT